MKKRASVFLVCVIWMLGTVGYTQSHTQTVRGVVIDQDTKIPLIGANIVVINSDPFLGSSSDIDGNFRIENVPVGRVNLKVSFLGYEERVLPNLMVVSGKELVITIDLTESIETLKEVQITAEQEKGEILNDMAVVSARAFSVEETKRYSGAINDPARMVSSFAGVTGDAQGNNDIVVRGNSPKGILWRLEGIEIPNPNHFANEGATGGPINALNSNMLSNSDFFSGAFSPEYGNAYSGIFDMNLRKGNNEKREYTVGVGILGTDVTLEGPFSKKNKASYLLNYRYSTLTLLDNFGVVDFQGIPKYQDASFKINVPTKKLGVFSIFGLGGISNIHTEDKEEDDTHVYSKGDFDANLGVVGLNHRYLINKNMYLWSSLSLAGSSNGATEHINLGDKFVEDYHDSFEKTALKFASTFNYKINAKNKVKSGFIYTDHSYNFYSNYFDQKLNSKVDLINEKGRAGLLQGFGSWKYRFNEDFTLISGFHYTQFLLNKKFAIEPRIGAQWKFNPVHTINLGVGMHSRVNSLASYFATVELDTLGTRGTPNKNLDFAKALHYVLGYDLSITENTHLKMELYYQDLYNVPIEDDISSNFSMLNSSEGIVNKNLVNEGTGRNYGMELTLERFFANKYYYMLTGSVYDSKYKGKDGIERKGRFSSDYAFNLLLGKEFNIGRAKNKTFGLSTKLAYLGGMRYTPINLPESIKNGETIRYNDKPYSEKGDDVILPNLTCYYRINKKRTTHEIKLEVLNVTNNQAKVTEYYNNRTKEIENGNQLPILPTIIYQIQF